MTTHFRLWHQLTQEIRAAQANPAFTASLNQKEFYDGCVFSFFHLSASSCNRLRLCTTSFLLAAMVLRFCKNEERNKNIFVSMFF